jgi:hypothetical protein
MYYVIYNKETKQVRNIIYGDITKSVVFDAEEYQELGMDEPGLTERIDFYKFIDGAFVLDINTKSNFELVNYSKMRVKEYPPLADFADAWVKQDEVALEEYRQACLAVKAKYPKP